MGRYINTDSKGYLLPAKGKAKALIMDGAKLTHSHSFNSNLICVVDNGIFEAAAYCDSVDEWRDFSSDDGRNKIWLLYEHAEKLAK